MNRRQLIAGGLAATGCAVLPCPPLAAVLPSAIGAYYLDVQTNALWRQTVDGDWEPALSGLRALYRRSGRTLRGL